MKLFLLFFRHVFVELFLLFSFLNYLASRLEDHSLLNIAVSLREWSPGALQLACQPPLLGGHSLKEISVFNREWSLGALQAACQPPLTGGHSLKEIAISNREWSSSQLAG